MTQEEPKLAKAKSFLARWPVAVTSAVIILLTLLIYAPTWVAPLHWDDLDYVRDNAFIRTWSGLYTIWFEPLKNLQYYPVLFTSYWIEYHLWGEAVWPQHVVNTAIHAGNSVLLLLALRRLKIPLAALIAILFACHPIQVESVVMIAERKNLLSFFFAMLSVLAWLRFEDLASRRRWPAYAAALICFVLAIQAKTILFVLPALLLLIQLHRHGRLQWRDVAFALPFVALAIPQMLIVRFVEHTTVGASGPDFEFSWPERALIAGRAIWFYIAKILWPYPLMPIYPRWQVHHAAAWTYAFPAAYGMMMLVLAALRRRLGHGPWMLAVAFLLIQGPALGFISFYLMLFTFVSDHHMYLGSVVVIMACVLLARLIARVLGARQKIPLMIAAAVVLLMAGMAINQGILWQSLRSIWTHNYLYNPTNSMVASNLGSALIPDKEYDLASELLTQAAQSPYQRYLAYYNLGIIRSEQKRYAEAANYFKLATEDFPQYYAAQRDLGAHLLMLRDFAGALTALNAAISIGPDDAALYARKSYCQWALGDSAGAVETARMAVRKDPNEALAQKVLNLVTTTPPPALQPQDKLYNSPPVTQHLVK